MDPLAWHKKWAGAETFCLTHAEWSAKTRDESCRFLVGPMRKDDEYTVVIVEALQKTPSISNIFSILYALIKDTKSQYQIISETGLARQTVADVLDSMLETKMITITPEPYQGVVDKAKMIRITDHGRKTYAGLKPVMDQVFPNWTRQIDH